MTKNEHIATEQDRIASLTNVTDNKKSTVNIIMDKKKEKKHSIIDSRGNDDGKLLNIWFFVALSVCRTILCAYFFPTLYVHIDRLN